MPSSASASVSRSLPLRGWRTSSRAAIPAATRRTGGHPAKRTFQALRIEVNGELASLERALPAAIAAVAVGGRVVVLSYHSLEDRLVKRAFAAGATSTGPQDLPVLLPEHEPTLRILTRGAAGPRRGRTRREPPRRLREVARGREAPRACGVSARSAAARAPRPVRSGRPDGGPAPGTPRPAAPAAPRPTLAVVPPRAAAPAARRSSCSSSRSSAAA